MIDGLLLQVGFGPGAEKVLGLAAAVPSVVFNEPGIDGLSSVQLDDEAAVRLATGHLIELGHRRLAFVSAHASSTSDRRRDAFLLEARTAPDKVHVTVVPSTGWTPQQSHHAVLRLLNRKAARPTGLMAVNTVAALGVMSGVAAAGLFVPRDVSVIAIHDTWFAPHLNLPLTTVRLPLQALGRTIVEQLVARLNGGDVAHVKINNPPPELLRRNSTGAPPATVV